MDQEILDKIYKRLEALEVVHTRYSGPPGKPGCDAKITLGRVESGHTASAQIREVGGNVYELNLVIPRGEDSTELETLRAERNEFREELNLFRKELHDFRATQNDWPRFIVTTPTHSASYATNHALKSTSDGHVWRRRSKEETRWKKRS